MVLTFELCDHSKESTQGTISFGAVFSVFFLFFLCFLMLSPSMICSNISANGAFLTLN